MRMLLKNWVTLNQKNLLNIHLILKTETKIKLKIKLTFS